jgi:hypothetical protein
MVDSHHSGMRSVGPVGSKQETSFVVALLFAAYDLLFGCHHANLSRIFTLDRQTYRVCLDCAAKLPYSLQTMSLRQSDEGGVHEEIGVLHPASCNHAVGGR